ncbi:hypothetical protein 8F11_75 [uncultured Caudovirales phage]|uniref:Uncharacterized protein n=1 Tax=uncultured Caudovirales phage TaxID=2100421 RepID=A0A2H4IZN8_9CAUD|nr:hypothetical protein 8F11_75 [uncultured Caudovirales phage]
MSNIKYTLSANGYVNSFVVLGELEGSNSVVVEDFNNLHFDCYREVNRELVWDEEKYQEKIKPTSGPKLPTIEDRINELEAIINMMLMGGLPNEK